MAESEGAKGRLEKFVESDSIENWFKWVEWTALTGGLFAACRFLEDPAAFWVVFPLGVISLIFCYMAAVPFLIRSLFGPAQTLAAKAKKASFCYFLVIAGSAAVVVLTITAITNIISATLASVAA